MHLLRRLSPAQPPQTLRQVTPQPLSPRWCGGLISPVALAAALATTLGMAGCAAPDGGGVGAAPVVASAPQVAAAASAPRPAASVPRPAASAPRPAAGASAPRPVAAVPPAAAGSAPAAMPPAPGQPPTFAVVIKDTKKIDALFAAWQKDDKVWLELLPTDFNKPFFLSPKLASGIGENLFFGGLMSRGVPQLVEFRRVYNQVQLVALNTEQVARAGTPAARAVEVARSVSLLGSTPVASQPHPDRKSVLIDGNALFMGDLLGLGAQLQRAYRQGYSFDGRNSSFSQVRGKPDLLVLEVNGHYYTNSIAVPTPGGPPGLPVPTVPSGVPDVRSLFLKVHYSLMRLPETPMARRAADPRVGTFNSATDDFSDDLARTPRQRFVNRWRLEKKDPAAALSEPVKPIVFWLDRNIPEAYRGAISAGALEWNKAFEAIGFKNAVEVRQQPDDADFDTLDAGVASIRWMVNHAPVFGAIGPSHVDPRSGEILDADIGIESLSSRNQRAARASIFGATSAAAWADLLQVAGAPAAAEHDAQQCRHGDLAAEQLGYALDLLAERAELDPAGPEAQQFVLDYLKDTTMHEVGHTLGLRHNFRASHVFTDRQVSDPAFTHEQAFTGSVMEYAPVNLSPPGAAPVAPFQTTLGPYDYWAIEYAYKPLAADQEKAELQRIAGRSGEGTLAFATDEDNFLGIDPDALMFDLGDDPVAFARRRFDIAADLFRRQERRELKPDEDFAGLRRALGYAVRDAGRAAGVLLRQIGGVRTLRDYANTGRDPLQPVSAADQRAAMALLTQRVLSAGAFAISPALKRRLAPDFFERAESFAGVPTDFPLGQNVLGLQRELLNQLMSDGLAQRVLDSEGKFAPGQDAFRLSELYSQLTADLWSELAAPRGDIAAPRRELQREHINRLATLVLRPGILSRTDARALVRRQASTLVARLDHASRRAGLSPEAKLHLQDSAESLRAALAAKMERTGA